MEADQEIELKLAVRPDRLARIASAPELRGAEPVRAKLQKLRNVYYDTPDLALHRRGIVLRVRRVGGQYIQTVKAGPLMPGGLFRRREWEHALDGPGPEPARVDDAAVREELVSFAGLLTPVFQSEVRRSTRLVQRGNAAAVEVAIDRGVVSTSRGCSPLCEIELELKSGNSDALFDLAQALNDRAPVRLESASKSERGYSLLINDRIEWSKAPPVELTRDASAADAFTAIVSQSLAHLLANERAAREGSDPEGIHQMRIALRRLRSIVSAFNPLLPQDPLGRLREDLRWLAAEIGRARNLDVFIDELLRPVRRSMPDDADLQILAERAATARSEAYEMARSTFSSERYTGTLLELARFVECRAFGDRVDAEAVERLAAPASSFAADFLGQRHQKARKRGRHFAALPAADRHRLRLAIKKLRYGAEFFRSLYDPDSSAPYLKRLSRLQSNLGHTSDVATARRLIDDLRGDTPPEEADALARAGGLVVGWHGRHAQDLEPKLKKLWKAFKATPPFWEMHPA